MLLPLRVSLMKICSRLRNWHLLFLLALSTASACPGGDNPASDLGIDTLSDAIADVLADDSISDVHRKDTVSPDVDEVTICPCDDSLAPEACVAETSSASTRWCARCSLCQDAPDCLDCTGSLDCKAVPFFIDSVLYKNSSCCPGCEDLPSEPVCAENGTVFRNSCAMVCANASGGACP